MTSGTLLWEHNPQKPGDDWASDIAGAGTQVFVCGTQTNTSGNRDFLVRAYDAVKGRLLWESVVDKGGHDGAAAIAVNSSSGRVFAVGSGATILPDPDYPEGNLAHYLVRAYNMNTGAPVWEQFGSAEGEFATHAVLASGRLLTVGVTNYCGFWWCTDGYGPAQDVLIRAYDGK